MDIVIAVVLGQVHEHTRSTAALSGTAETAVTDAPARGAKPIRAQEGITDIFSVSVLQTRPAELPTNSHTFWVAAVGLGVGCFLSTLMAGGSSGPVVKLLSDIDTDVVQFSLSDFLHRPHDMRDCQSAVIAAPTWLFLFFVIVVVISADQAVFVLGLILWKRGGWSIHQ